MPTIESTLIGHHDKSKLDIAKKQKQESNEFYKYETSLKHEQPNNTSHFFSPIKHD